MLRRFLSKNNKEKQAAVILMVAGLFCVLLPAQTVLAQYSGTSYKIEEAQVGAAGSDNELSSGSFIGRATAGDTGVGIVKGTNFQAVGGFTTSDTPELEVRVAPLSLDLGNASTASALTGSTKFSVRAYLSGGYSVFAQGAAPTQESGSALSTLVSQTASTPGTEQFGIYVVANNVPSGSTVCSDLPDSTFSFGVASAGYQTAALYKYVNGDKIAESPSSSGCTEYTVNYLVNISGVTKAGQYTFTQNLGVVATY